VDPKDVRPAEWPPLDAGEILRRLTESGVDFVVIGGIAMLLHGSSRLTRDLDIVFAPDDANLRALGEVLIGLQSRLRGVEEVEELVPDHRTLANVQLLTLSTAIGWLDVHRRPEGAPPYESLRRRAERMDLDGFQVLVASPDDLMAMKRAAGRPVDLADLEELAAIKRLRRKAGA
jgi:Nucleotidyl transferase AbiEii toxin, Type IV TA system